MLERPALAGPGEVALAAQQERGQAKPRAHQIRAQVLPAADQVAQLLLLLAGNPDQPQIAGREQAREADRVALVGLDPIAGRRSMLPGEQTAISIPSARARRTSR
jgi:hypothetical protein